MKYTIISTAIAMLMTSSAFAAEPFASVKYKYEDAVSSKNNRSGYEITVGDKLNDTVSVDITTENLVQSNGGPQTNRLEVGATGSLPVGPVSLYARGSVGEKFVSGNNNFGYYSIEPGVSVPLPVSGLSANLGYRFRDAFSSNQGDQTRTLRAGVQYQLTKTFTLNAGYENARGDLRYNGYSFGVSAHF
jgi:opacity protein-like surface antigen